MKSIKEFINEAGGSTKWAAISIVTKGYDSWSKEQHSERVVTWDSYCEMKDKGHTKSHSGIISLELLGTANSREAAENYLTPKNVNKRKSKLNIDGFDFVCWAIPCGKIQVNGKTKFGWNIWENSDNAYIYACATQRREGVYANSMSFIYASKDTFKKDDIVLGIDNDTEKILPGFSQKVVGCCPCNLESFQKMIKELVPTECKRPQRAFGRISDGLPWNKFGQVYSCKGTIEAEKYNLK